MANAVEPEKWREVCEGKAFRADQIAEMADCVKSVMALKDHPLFAGAPEADKIMALSETTKDFVDFQIESKINSSAWVHYGMRAKIDSGVFRIAETNRWQLLSRTHICTQKV